MSDPAAARAGRDRSRKGPHRRGGPHRHVRWATVLVLGRTFLIAAGLVTAYYLLPMDRYGARGTSEMLLAGLLAVIVVFLWEVRTIMRSPHPRLKAVEALAATVVLFLVLFASAYYLLDRSAPGSFTEPLSKTDALYFTMTTFSTVGFGDIAARTETGRVMAMLQMAGGLLLVGLAARVLAGAVQEGLRRRVSTAPVTESETDAETDATTDADSGNETETET